MAKVLLISVLILLLSFVVDFSNDCFFPTCSVSPNRSHLMYLDEFYCCSNVSFGNFSGTSSIITRCCCNVLPTSSLSLSGLAGPGPSLFSSVSVLLWSRPAGSVQFRPRTARRPATVLVSLLLLMSGDVEINPGPVTPVNTVNELNFGCLNARNKAALIHDLINDSQLDILTLT